MQYFPQVELDTTLAELCARNKAEGTDKRIAMVLCAPNSEAAPSSKITRNTKYAYQDSTFCETAEDVSPKKHQEMQQEISVKYLSLIP